jgi:hypothetical protein
VAVDGPRPRATGPLDRVADAHDASSSFVGSSCTIERCLWSRPRPLSSRHQARCSSTDSGSRGCESCAHASGTALAPALGSVPPGRRVRMVVHRRQAKSTIS